MDLINKKNVSPTNPPLQKRKFDPESSEPDQHHVNDMYLQVSGIIGIGRIHLPSEWIDISGEVGYSYVSEIFNITRRQYLDITKRSTTMKHI